MNDEPRLKKNMILVIVLTISAASIYMLPYLRNYYYDAFLEAFQLTHEQSGLAGAYFGLFGAAGYLLGGLLSDKVSFKILVPGSLIVSGGLGLYLLTVPSPAQIALIHGVWGITSLVTFWPALVKALRAAGNSNEQGRVFGIFEGGRGITNAIVFAIAAALFGVFYVAEQRMSGIRPLILLFSALPITLGIANIFLLRNVKVENSGKAEGGINFKMIGNVLKNPFVWLMSLMIFASYATICGYFYISSYANTVFSVSLLAAAILSSSSQYIRPFACMIGGAFADKISSSKVMQYGFLITVIGLGIVFFTPSTGSVIPIVIGALIVFAGMFVTFAMNFAVMEEVEFPAEASGTIIGICCTIGYLPEAIVPFVGGKILDTHALDSPDGYKMIVLFLLVVTIFGMIVTRLWMKKTKERRMEMLAARKLVVKSK